MNVGLIHFLTIECIAKTTNWEASRESDGLDSFLGRRLPYRTGPRTFCKIFSVTPTSTNIGTNDSKNGAV